MNYCSKMERHWNASAQTQIAVLEYVLKLASADPFMGPGIPEFTPKDEGLQRALPDPCKDSKHVQDLGAPFPSFSEARHHRRAGRGRHINHLPHSPYENIKMLKIGVGRAQQCHGQPESLQHSQ